VEVGEPDNRDRGVALLAWRAPDVMAGSAALVLEERAAEAVLAVPQLGLRSMAQARS
jgi:hypothetical protein